MPGLNEKHGITHIFVISDDRERFRAALMLALTQQALGRDARIFLHLDAVVMLVPPIAAHHDTAHEAAGLPSLSALLEEALEGGITVTACQSGLDSARISADSIDPRILFGGLLSFMASIRPEDRLLTI